MSKPIAIRVSTNMQLNAVLDYNTDKGFKKHELYSAGKSYPSKAIYNIIPIENNWLQIDESNTLATRQYEVISFENFSALTSVKAIEEITINTQDVQYKCRPDMVYAKLLGGHDFFLYYKDLQRLYDAWKGLEG